MSIATITPHEPLDFTTSPAPHDPELKEVHANGVKVGYYSQMHATAWAGSYLATRTIAVFETAAEALDFVVVQHRAVVNLARSVRALRPAPMLNAPGTTGRAYDDGYNQALRDVERVVRTAVGAALDGEGYTAITR